MSRSSPPPPDPASPALRTGSYPAVVSDVRPESTADRALRISLQNRDQIGRPPVEATGDPGAGLWATMAKVQSVCLQVLAWTKAADEAEARRGGWVARIGWRSLETLIPIAIVAIIAWAAGFHR